MALIAAIAVPLTGGILSSLTMRRQDMETWYKYLHKPAFTPPNWVFGPVWTSLYSMMGYSSYLVWKNGGFEQNSTALSIYGLHLVANWAWTPIFFRAHKLGPALLDLTVWLGAAATCYHFSKTNSLAAWLLVPYMGWLSLAWTLNFTIWQLNKTHR